MSKTTELLKKTYEGIRDEHRQNANTATRIGNAFLAMLSYLLDEGPYISKEHDDFTNFVVNFLAGLKVGDDVSIKDGTAELKAVKSKEFVDGTLGNGFKLWESDDRKTHLTIDNLTVRERMIIMEMLVSKVRSIGGQLIISAASGKIKSVVREGDFFHVFFKDNNQFVAHDLIRCSRLDGKNLRDYWVEVSSADSNSIYVAVAEFSGQLPKPDDECVLMGNTSDTARQNLILLSASEDGQPHISVMSGVKSKTLADCTKTRIGALDGIHDSLFPADMQPSGYGIYCDNAYLKGHLYFSNGENVRQRIEAGEGKFRSEIEGIRNEIDESDTFLQNPNFAKGMRGWTTAVDGKAFILSDKLIFANGKMLANLHAFSRIEKSEGRNVMRIKHSFIKQKNSDLRFRPDFEQDSSTGLKKPVMVNCSFIYKVKQQGHLSVRFENFSKNGFEKFDMFDVTNKLLPINSEYKQFTYSGLWNGTGDFVIRFTGDITISALVLSSDELGALTFKYKTLFSQSDRLVKLTSAIYDKNEELLKETGLMIKPEGSGIFAQDLNGNVAFIGAAIEENGKSVIKIGAENIRLEGLVTANAHFRVNEDGSIEATAGKIAGFDIKGDHIGAESTADGNGGSLSIYPDYIRVGSEQSFTIFGDNVIPLSQSSEITAAARIVNNKKHISSLPTINYGMVINVSGAKRNIGLLSNAALHATAFIQKSAAIINLTGSEYSMDLSQNNIFLIYASVFSEMSLPDESLVRTEMGMSQLPNDFAMVLTLHIQNGSKEVVVKNVYNENAVLSDLKLSAGDSAQLLLTKADGFAYHVLNKII